MKRNHKKLILLSCLCAVMALGQGCAKWLDVNDSDKIIMDNYWQTHEQVSSNVSGAYKLFQEAWRETFRWGELRADAMEMNSLFTGDDPTWEEYQEVKNIDIPPGSTNPLLHYYRMYAVIGACNHVIDNAPRVVSIDENLTQVQCDQYINEMKWLRSLCYFYLVRTFRDVPYVTKATMNDVNPFAVAKTDGIEILKLLIEELKEATKPNTPGTLPPSYQGWGWEQRGRATAYAAFALMADIYLWLGEGYYDDAIEACDKIINGGSSIYSLLQRRPNPINETGSILVGYEYLDDWFNLWGQSMEVTEHEGGGWSIRQSLGGNTKESIFEVQYGTSDQSNELIGWTWNDKKASDIRWLVSSDAIQAFGKFDTAPGNNAEYLAGVVDQRGESASFLKENSRLWKYVGYMRALQASGGSTRGLGGMYTNTIIYRLAEVYLMKAEALIMQERYAEAQVWIDTIRHRAGYNDFGKDPSLGQYPSYAPDQTVMLEILLEERLREFLGEGKRWFDLTRVAIRDNGKHSEMVIAILSKNISNLYRERYKDNLRKPGFYAFFLPIHQDEIEAAGGVLVQNPFYR